MEKILVWDAPVRLGHWLMVGGFILAWLTSESESLRLVHAASGGAVLGAILFRLVWGVVGTRHARFASFVRAPGTALSYFRDLVTGRAPHTAGHNPAGAYAILALLGLGLAAGATGWLIYNDLDGHWVEELHEGLAQAMLVVALVHVAGVVAGSLAHRENLLRAMVTGAKRGLPTEAIAGARPLAALLLLGWVVACAWYLAR